MRQYEDDQRRRWTVLVGRESYGMQVLLFFPDGGGEVLKSIMAADTRLGGQRELDAMSDAELAAALERAVPWGSDSLLPGG
jgi:hypothetical protein